MQNVQMSYHLSPAVVGALAVSSGLILILFFSGFMVLLYRWQQEHIQKTTCRYCGEKNNKHDDHCPWQGRI